MDINNVVANQTQGLTDSLEIQLKAERVQEPASLQAEPFAAYTYGLSVRPVQPISITLSGSSILVTLHGPGGAADSGPAGAA